MFPLGQSINTLKNNIPLPKEKEVLSHLLQSYYQSIQPFDFTYSKGILYLSKVPPLYRLHIKMNKQDLKKKAYDQGIIIRDII